MSNPKRYDKCPYHFAIKELPPRAAEQKDISDPEEVGDETLEEEADNRLWNDFLLSRRILSRAWM